MSSRVNQEIAGYGSDFSGGMAPVKQPTTLAANEFALMDNVVVKPKGAGFRSRRGNSKLNTSQLESGAAVTGIGFYKAAGVESLLAVCNGKIYLSSGLAASMSDITGSLTISATETDRWVIFQADDITIGVGGAPNAPWMYTGSGNASLLAGSPPSGDFGFVYNNRAFIGVASTSKLYWSTLDNAQDWTSSGSGNLTVQGGDGDELVTALPLSINTVLLLKDNSVHVMTGRTAPFPSFPLVDGSGCVGKNAACVADGLGYWITPAAKLAICDGSRIYDERDVPALSNADSVLASLDSLSNIQVAHQIGSDFNWIVISGTSEDATQNDFALAWDLTNKCWVQCSTGYEANGFAVSSTGQLYMAGYDGYVYAMDQANVTSDASNGSAAVTWTLDSDWLSRGGLLRNVAQVAQLNVAYQGREAGSMTCSYGYDFVEPLANSLSFSIQTTGAVWDTSLWDTGVWGSYVGKMANPRLLGRGNVFKFTLSGSSSTSYEIYKLTLFGKDTAQKNYGVR